MLWMLNHIYQYGTSTSDVQLRQGHFAEFCVDL